MQLDLTYVPVHQKSWYPLPLVESSFGVWMELPPDVEVETVAGKLCCVCVVVARSSDRQRVILPNGSECWVDVDPELIEKTPRTVPDWALIYNRQTKKQTKDRRFSATV